MSRRILVLSSVLIVIVVCAIWLAWTRPKTSDMAAFAPADSLVYLESNEPTAVIDALNNTQAGKLVASFGASLPPNKRGWVQAFVRWTGLAPTESVILARSQVAVVITDLRVAENDDSLTVKPEGSLIIETHTSERRVRAVLERELQNFAGRAYANAQLQRATVDANEFLKWAPPDHSREIVGTTLGSILIVGNSEVAVRKVLGVVRGQQPSLLKNAELHSLRQELGATQALAFGFVSSNSSPHLLSVLAPVMLGRAPNNAELLRLIDSGAAKLIGNLAWTSKSVDDVIEDQYLIGVQRDAMSQLNAQASLDSSSETVSERVGGITSITNYRFKDPDRAWQALRTAVSSRVDAVSAIVFSTLLKSALLSYGINDPDRFLSLVAVPLSTIRLEDSSNTLLIGQVKDESAMRALLTGGMGYRAAENANDFFNSELETSARIDHGRIALGSAEDIDRYYHIPASPSNQHYAPLASDACAVTYANDSERVRAFILALLTARGRKRTLTPEQDTQILALPDAVTQTSLREDAVLRITRSPLGQFSTILPLLFPEPSGTQP